MQVKSNFNSEKPAKKKVAAKKKPAPKKKAPAKKPKKRSVVSKLKKLARKLT